MGARIDNIPHKVVVYEYLEVFIHNRVGTEFLGFFRVETSVVLHNLCAVSHASLQLRFSL